MTIFGRRSMRPAVVDVAAASHVYMIHYVEHDKVVTVQAQDMQRACTFARTHARILEPMDACIDRCMYYDDDRICVMLYGNDMRYTCNIMRMPVYDAATRIDITLPS